MKTPLLIFVIALTSLYYAYDVSPACERETELCYDLHLQILNHTAPAPYRYRILTPALAQLLAGRESEKALLWGYTVFHLGCFIALFSGLYIWLHKWADETRALVGVLILAVLFPLAFRHYYLSPWAAFEIALMCWGLVCLSSMRPS